ncbi:chemotaxis protein CheA [bacterium]|jgi:two-component system, chemotaxis family, sensor kinase CheA|nr:chemotaxis protein CheA [bacterium]
MEELDSNILSIFIEEAEEIIENLELQLSELETEEDSSSLINEIFRGVHTLKGNANSFGFETLGSFVHSFENLLEILRNNPNLLDADLTSLLYQGFDIVKETFEEEKEGNKKKSQNYKDTLNQIELKLDSLENQNLTSEKKPNKLLESLSFLNEDNVSEENEKSDNELNKETIDKLNFSEIREIIEKEDFEKTNESIYNIKMNFDTDFHIRGYEPSIFFSLFEEKGKIIKSFAYLSSEIPDLENLDLDLYSISEISMYIYSNSSEEELTEIFDFIAEPGEYSLLKISKDILLKKNVLVELSEEKSLDNEPSVDESSDNEPSDDEPSDNTSKRKKEKESDSTLRISGGKVDDLFNSVGELVIAQSFLEHNPNIIQLNDPDIKNQLSHIQKITKSVQNRVMELRMIPIKNTFMKLKRTVRDVSLKINKDIDLIIKGEDSELDKSMVDSLGEPLIHLIRNAIDHGIESKEERIKSNKSEKGTVKLSAFHKGSNFIIEIKDDGRGIDKEVVLKKAILNNIADDNKTYSDKEIYAMLFKPGFSTAEEITDISGRGVGLDSVQSSVQNNKGKLIVTSELGTGTTFQIVLPLTLAIIDGMVVKIDGETYIIPILSIVETFKATNEAVKSFSEDNKFINYRGEMLPILNIHEAMGKETAIAEDEYINKLFICIEHSRGNFIIPVDKIIGKQQVVIKSLNKTIFNQNEVSGATILGDGGLSLILNIDGLSEKIYFVEDN